MWTKCVLLFCVSYSFPIKTALIYLRIKHLEAVVVDFTNLTYINQSTSKILYLQDCSCLFAWGFLPIEKLLDVCYLKEYEKRKTSNNSTGCRLCSFCTKKSERKRNITAIAVSL